MAEYAIYDNDVFTGMTRNLGIVPTLPGKPYREFYLMETVNPAYDSATQVKEGPTIQEDHVNKIRRTVYTVRAKTAQELDADKDVKVDSMDKVVFQILFNHENRIRTLAGQNQVTLAQFKTAVKGLINGS
jgi:hypothetical protein